MAKAKLNIVLARTEFGNPILRKYADNLSLFDIKTSKTQHLITAMKSTLSELKLGVGLAAPQVGEGVALSVVLIQPTKHRQDVKPFELVIINPEITQTYGRKKQMWEGCISAGQGKAGMFAKVPRYTKIHLKYLDQNGAQHNKIFTGLPAQVIQHEVDHLKGILFVDRVKDTKTYVTYREYLKIVAEESEKPK